MEYELDESVSFTKLVVDENKFTKEPRKRIPEKKRKKK